MPDPTLNEIPWWKKTTVYQIYPRSFRDSNGDGIGDLPGIISKLDYLQKLGIETIWFSPFFSSPQVDHGYDVSDFRGIAPEYGTMADCEKLIQEIHNRDMYIVFDMVLNHTSEQHPWFKESRSSRSSSKRDWYIWRDGKKPGGKKPPNNWKSLVGGSGWHYDDHTDQWYWAQFLPFQPDLNYRNPDVKEEMFDIVRFWLEKGVDGYRLDIINAIYEDESLQNNPFNWRYFPNEEYSISFFQNRIYTMNHPDTFTFVKELRSVMDEYTDPERFLVGEVAASLEVLKRYYGDPAAGKKTNGLHLTFLFQTLNAKLDENTLRSLLSKFEQHFPEPLTPTWVFSNHDQMRRITKLGNDIRKAKLNAVLQMTVRGVPFIYYGEEIGMLNHRLPLKTAQDPIAQRYKWIPQTLVNLLTNSGSFSLNRDDCRTPMQWDSSPNAGFCSEELDPWLRLSPSHETVNVDLEESDPDSLLNCYKDLLQLRRETPALHAGSMCLLPPFLFGSGLLSFQRVYNEQVVQVWLNLSNKPLQTSEIGESPKLLFSTLRKTDPLNASELHLEPYEGVVLSIHP